MREPQTDPLSDDGYRLTYGGLDYLALHAHTRTDTLYSVGNQIGTGKESDIFVAAAPSGVSYVLKIHRLGRISFRQVRNTRDYLRGKAARKGNQGGSSWMHMSRLAALKEYTFMAALRDAGFRVPKPIAHNRHTLVMELIDAFPLRKVSKVPDPSGLYAELMDMIVRLARVGLIHGDFNEFNILIREETVRSGGRTPKEEEERKASTGGNDRPTEATPATPENPALILTPVLIDFPQMVSTSHANAQWYFDRDVRCIRSFFERRFGFVSDEPGPFLEEAIAKEKMGQRIDVAVEASGFSKKMAKELEGYMKEVGVDGDRGGEMNESAEEDEEEEDVMAEQAEDEDANDLVAGADQLRSPYGLIKGGRGEARSEAIDSISTADASAISHSMASIQIGAKT